MLDGALKGKKYVSSDKYLSYADILIYNEVSQALLMNKIFKVQCDKNAVDEDELALLEDCPAVKKWLLEVMRGGNEKQFYSGELGSVLKTADSRVYNVCKQVMKQSWKDKIFM